LRQTKHIFKVIPTRMQLPNFLVNIYSLVMCKNAVSDWLVYITRGLQTDKSLLLQSMPIIHCFKVHALCGKQYAEVSRHFVTLCALLQFSKIYWRNFPINFFGDCKEPYLSVFHHWGQMGDQTHLVFDEMVNCWSVGNRRIW